jgi:hypothetical protein
VVPLSTSPDGAPLQAGKRKLKVKMEEVLPYIKLTVIVLVPLWLLTTRRHNGLLLWIGATLGVEVFNVSVFGPNLQPLEMVGLVYLPFAAKDWQQISRTAPGKWLAFSLGLLFVLGILYGYLFPWPDLTGERGWTQVAAGRSVIYLGHMILLFSVSFYIAQRVQTPGTINRLLRYIIIGTSIAAIGALIQQVTNTDILPILSPGARDWTGIERLRGFNGEPRITAQWCAMGFLLLFGMKHYGRGRLPLLMLHGIALFLTVSSAGIITLIAGMGMIILFSGRRIVVRVAIALILSVLLLVITPLLESTASNIVGDWEQNIMSRLLKQSADYTAETNLGETIANRLEVFDASAFRFLWYNPTYFLLGTGPGLVSLPASDYMSALAISIYGDRIDSIPHSGAIQVLSNSGIVGVLLWLGLVVSAYQAIARQAKVNAELEWQDAKVFFVVFSALFALQAVLPIWYLFFGVDLGAALIISKSDQQASIYDSRDAISFS